MTKEFIAFVVIPYFFGAIGTYSGIISYNVTQEKSEAVKTLWALFFPGYFFYAAGYITCLSRMKDE